MNKTLLNEFWGKCQTEGCFGTIEIFLKIAAGGVMEFDTFFALVQFDQALLSCFS
jgi:hypothetical protein